MKNSLKSILAALFILSAGTASAQPSDALMKTLNEKMVVEKIYIQYDKDNYVAGETVFFKAYLLHNGSPSLLSNNFFLQFLNSNGQIIRNLQLPISGAVTKGSFDIPDSLPQGNYIVRALTPVNLNNDEAYIYKKVIYVFNSSATPAVIAAKVPNVNVQFFPESGKLVDGILSVVAFKATDENGQPINISGVILTSDGNTIAPFKTYHDGIGKLQFKPVAGKKYMAEVDFNGSKRNFPLPEVSPAGISLKVSDEKGGKQFLLSRAGKDMSEFSEVELVITIRNEIVYDMNIAFESYPSVLGHIITDSLPSGILHFTIFNKDGLPLAERLSFVNNGEYKSAAEINPSQVSFTKRAANDWELSFPEAAQRSCAVSITDITAGNAANTDNIWSRFLLTSDLRGTVYNPAWYFDHQDDSVKLALDNLMLTHGWTRYSWTKILKGEFPENKFTDENLLRFSGLVIDDKNKQPVTGGKLNIYIEAEDSSTQNYEFPVGANGRFLADSLIYYGKTKMYYSYLDKDGKVKPGIIVADSMNMKSVAGMNQPEYFNQLLLSGQAVISKEEMQARASQVKILQDEYKELSRVTVRSKTNKKPIDLVTEKYASGVFSSPGKVDIDLINEPVNDKTMNVVDYFMNRIQQLELQGGAIVNRKNMSLISGRKWLVGLFLDESPVDINQLRTIMARDVALIKFYEAGFVGVGSGFPGGAVAVYQKDKSESDPKQEKLAFIQVNGYSITKEFFSPDYANPDFKAPAQDNRTTLYWNPNFFTDKENKPVHVKFFNNDHARKFKLVIEGIDASGKLMHTEKIVGE